MRSSEALHETPDESLSDERHLDVYLRHVFIPWTRIGEITVVAVARDTIEVRRAVVDTVGHQVRLEAVSKQKIIDALQRRFRVRLADDAQFALDRADSNSSARRVVTPRQRWIIVAIVAGMMASAIMFRELVEPAAYVALAALYAVTIGLRHLLFAAGWFLPKPPRQRAVLRARADDLPIYSILVPLYDEACMVPAIARALRRLDYPNLDIKLILEECDVETIAAARALNLDDRFEVLVVPPSKLRTKPRACNYALSFVRGEYVVIFDAEDRPESDQLIKAVSAFRTQPDIACFQARLGYYNRDSAGLLAKLFAIEYAGWFAIMLPGMARLRIPIPLGGTSNHFRTSALREIGGWDAYNVTEDADVGLRLARRGHRAAPLNSVTWEEAVSAPGAWIKQRSRWTKGYMQTVLVHLREPLRFVWNVGWMRYFACILFLASAAIGPLATPFLWALSLYWSFFGGAPDGTPYFLVFAGSLLLGTGFITVLNILGPLRTGEDRFATLGILAPMYWLMMSAAAWWSLFELVTGKASLWQKTKHGVEHRPPCRRRTMAMPRLAFVSAGVAASVLALTSYAAFGNPWLKQQGSAEIVGTLRALRSIDGFAAEPSTSGAVDVHGEYGITDGVTVVIDDEVKADGDNSDAHLDFQTLARVFR